MSSIIITLDTGSDEHAIATDILLAALAKSLEGHVTRGEATFFLLEDGTIEDETGRVLHRNTRRNQQERQPELL